MIYFLITAIFLLISFFVRKYFKYLEKNKLFINYIDSLKNLSNLNKKNYDPEVIFNNISRSALKLLLCFFYFLSPYLIFYIILDFFTDNNYLLNLLFSSLIYWPLIKKKNK